jgi:hypothetical protein
VSLEDRFSLAVHRRLGELGGTGTLLAAGDFDHRGELVRHWDLSVVQEGLDQDGQRVKYRPLEGAGLAVALAEAGWLATNLVVLSACDPGKGRASKSRRALKATSPEAGATAAIFMAHGMSEVISAVRPDRRELHQHSRQVLGDHLPWSDDADDEIAKIAQIAFEPQYDSEVPEYELFWRTLLRLMPEDQARKLPGISSEPLLGNLYGIPSADAYKSGVADHSVEAYLSALGWRITCGQYRKAYLALADPALLDALEREEDDHASPPGR